MVHKGLLLAMQEMGTHVTVEELSARREVNSKPLTHVLQSLLVGEGLQSTCHQHEALTGFCNLSGPRESCSMPRLFDECS